MTIEQRNAKITEALKEQTRISTISREAARAALINGSIYTKGGNLKAQFGGRNWKAKISA